MNNSRIIVFVLLLLFNSHLVAVATANDWNRDDAFTSSRTYLEQSRAIEWKSPARSTRSGMAGDPGSDFLGGINNPSPGNGIAGDPGDNFISSSDGAIGDNLYFLLLLVALYGTMDWIRKKNKRKTVK